MAVLTTPRLPRQRELSTAVYEASERRRIAWMSALAVGASILLGQAIIRIGPAAIAIPITVLVLAGVAWRPRIGLYVLLAAVLLFEEASPDDLMLPGGISTTACRARLGCLDSSPVRSNC